MGTCWIGIKLLACPTLKDFWMVIVPNRLVIIRNPMDTINIIISIGWANPSNRGAITPINGLIQKFESANINPEYIARDNPR